MGSLPDHTICYYCGVNYAGYIPDGARGPVCGPCIDVGVQQGWEHVFQKLVLRLWPACAARIAAVNHSMCEYLVTLLAIWPTMPSDIVECLEDSLLSEHHSGDHRSPSTSRTTAPSTPRSPSTICRSRLAPCCSHRYMADKRLPFRTTDHMEDVYEGWKPPLGSTRPLEPQYLPVRFKRVRSAPVLGVYDPDWLEGGLRPNPFQCPTDSSMTSAASDIADSDGAGV
jgi:hypothetical protein